MLYAGAVLQNRYEIIKIIGRGGMSTVYQARDLTNNQLLAVKDVNRTGSQNNQEMEQKLAVSEVNILKRLLHPSLPKIHEVIENTNSFMLVMDFIEGESLDKVIAREGRQPVDKVLDWGMQICQVFHYLHNQPTPIIYRDMKPANVMLRPDGQLMMIDFGTARTLKANVNMQADTICIGTAGFAAPEQFGGIGQSTERTDIFCLGATLYNMVTGHSPSEKPIGILPLEQWDPALAGTPISEIIYKCTRGDPNERYQNAMELYEDLRMAKEGTYSSKNIRGKSGPLSGKLRGGWQKSDQRGILTGRLLGGTGQSGSLQKKPETGGIKETDNIGNSAWQRNELVSGISSNQANTILQQENEAYEEESVWRKLMMICLVIAVIFVAAAVVLTLLQVIIGAIIFLMIAAGAAVLALIGAIYEKRSR